MCTCVVFAGICILSLHLLPHLHPHPSPVSFVLWLGLIWPSQASNLPRYLCRYSHCCLHDIHRWVDSQLLLCLTTLHSSYLQMLCEPVLPGQFQPDGRLNRASMVTSVDVPIQTEEILRGPTARWRARSGQGMLKERNPFSQGDELPNKMSNPKQSATDTYTYKQC